MGKITEHFDSREFNCNCGNNKIIPEFVKHLEKIYEYLDNTETGCSAIVVTSGYRCPQCSGKVGGKSNDAHTMGFAADVIAYHANREIPYQAVEVAAVAEYLGFSGIGICNGGLACHCDDRAIYGYINNHWYGDERNGNDNITTFKQYLIQQKKNVSRETLKHKIKIYLDDKLINETEL